MGYYGGNNIDLLTNMQLQGGRAKCHHGLDFLLSSSGDIAFTDEGSDNMRQRLLLYLATPKRNRVDPTVGCSYYEYIHEKMTEDNLAYLAGDLKEDLRTQFPEWDIQDVECFQGTNNREIRVNVIISTETVDLLLSTKDMEEISAMLAESMYWGG